MTGSPLPRRRRLVSLLVALTMTAVGACGVAANDEPHVIAQDELPPGLVDQNTSTSTSVASPTVAPVTIYYVMQQEASVRLVGVTREVESAERPRDRILAVLAPPRPEESALGYLTSIPAETVLLDSELDDTGQLTLDLSQSLFDVQGQELRNAFAQLVWTATEMPQVHRVRFLVEGREVRAPDEAGIQQPGAVTRSHYLTLAPA